MSTTTTAVNGEEFYSGDPAPLLQRLAADGVARVYIDGGTVIRQLLGAGLVDDLTLSIIPVVLGDGIRLWDVGMAERRLALRSSRAFPSGLVQIEYEVE
jgi:dihydrofolate reductase